MAVGTALKDFVVNPRRDRNTRQAGFDLRSTIGPAGSEINRLETFKRILYGRRGGGLLRARIRHAA